MRPLDADEPTVVGPYRLLGRLGSGGMGRVYLGRSAGGRTVAVKIVHPHFALDEEFRARFRREVDAARRVGAAWTAPVLDADPDARVPWVATAYAAGPSLTAAVTDVGPLPEHTVRALGAGLAEALTAVHGLGLVHRDVKPSNVLLTLDGPLLIDFGIARATGGTSRTKSGGGTASLTSTGVSIGSPGYMSPEQILGKGVTGAADVFSLGAVLAYAATGTPPFPGDSSAALLYRVVHEPPELDGLTGDLREVTEACLGKDPAARPSPAEITRRLAPEGGAARLVSGGWLPGALVEQVSRSAVSLLNLEAAGGPAGGPAGGAASGPVDFSSPSVGEHTVPGGAQGAAGGDGSPAVGDGTAGGGSSAGGGSVPASGTSPGGPAAASGPSAGGPAAGDGAPAGVSVPASGTPAGVSVPTPGSPPGVFVPDPGTPAGGPSGAGAVTGTFGPPPVMPPVKPPSDGARTDTGVPEPRHALDHGPAGSGVPHPPTQPGDRGTGDPGRLSVSVSAASTPGAGGRGRRVSCTVALAVAGALAAVTVGSVFVFDLLPGASRVADSGEGPSGDRPSASQPTGTVPAAYLGTWEGQAASRDSISIPLGTFRVTLTQARVGERVGTLRHTDLFGGICDDVLTLKEVTAQRIVTTSVGAGTNRGVCNQARHTVRLTPVGDDLVYESDSKESGSPKARLSKIE
ncbi:protein kinase [Streptomyces sp. Vc74B-19]|uniref:serine/threonine-protein kinase n=1 Tax=Streptomyces sp. Vc74B-19 TaxID=2741324 RepID=UPI001BFC8015|nr:serine/threonine-protein kinase [Streptomyces sp. Vc74B-19]MBT3163927.1 protein kinase [Streptomyces sp. Vc74B-19]